MVSVLNRGGRAKSDAAISAAVYEAVLTELGATGTIVPLGDPIYRTGATTFRSVSGVSGLETAIWTASEAPELFATPPTRQGICPVIHLNGSDEAIVSVDNSYWTVDDAGGANGFSLGAWINLPASTAEFGLLGKLGSNINEWKLSIRSGFLPRLFLRDSSAGAGAYRIADSAYGAAGEWHNILCVYNGNGGATAGAGITIYVDAVAVAQTATENSGGTYVGMEDSLAIPMVGKGGTSEQWFNGKIAGGASAPFWTQAQLTAEQVMNIYRIQKGALAL